MNESLLKQSKQIRTCSLISSLFHILQETQTGKLLMSMFVMPVLLKGDRSLKECMHILVWEACARVNWAEYGRKISLYETEGSAHI